MYKFAFALLALSVSLFATQSSWASTCSPAVESSSCTNTFTPGDPIGIYEFGTDGKLTVQFDTVLTTFSLTVTAVEGLTLSHPLDPTVFPNTACVIYSNGQCVEYNFSGGPGPNGVPVKNVDYKRLITLTLSYFVGQTVHTPAFGHAPGDNATAVYNEDILTAYSSSTDSTDPTMVGKVPGLSSVAALDEQLIENDINCNAALAPSQVTYSAAATKEIELTFQLFAGTTCPATGGTPLRDKTAHFSLTYRDVNGVVTFPPMVDREEGNKFHWDNKNGLNEFDLSTVGLPTGKFYTITIFSSKASPVEITFTLNP
jgi:hypothetical protein